MGSMLLSAALRFNMDEHGCHDQHHHHVLLLTLYLLSITPLFSLLEEMCGNWSQYFAEIVWHMPISNPGGYHWSMKSCTSSETSIIHSRCSWICSIRFLISRSFISWGFLTRFIFVSIVLRNGHEVIINIYTKDSWINLSTCICSCFYFSTCFSYLTSGPQEEKLGHLLVFSPCKAEKTLAELKFQFDPWLENFNCVQQQHIPICEIKLANDSKENLTRMT